MTIKDRPTTTMKFTEARAHLSELFNRVAKQETSVLVEKNGVPVGAIISPRDYERLQKFDREEREELIAALTEVGNAFRDVPDDEIEREVEKAVAEARAELRPERERMSGE